MNTTLRNRLSAFVSNLYKGESVYYVYEHFDPDTRKVVYVGYGVDGRAYTIFRPEGRRNKDHAEWGAEMALKGYLPHECVRFRAYGVSKKSAQRIEKDILRKYKELGNDGQLFNKKFPKVQLWTG